MDAAAFLSPLGVVEYRRTEKHVNRCSCSPKGMQKTYMKMLFCRGFCLVAWAWARMGASQGRTGADQRGEPSPQGVKIGVAPPLDQVTSSTRDFFPTVKNWKGPVLWPPEIVPDSDTFQSKTRHRITYGGDCVLDFMQIRCIPPHSIVSLSAKMSRLLPALRW